MTEMRREVTTGTEGCVIYIGQRLERTLRLCICSLAGSGYRFIIWKKFIELCILMYVNYATIFKYQKNITFKNLPVSSYNPN